jgi:hypothetical protein
MSHVSSSIVCGSGNVTHMKLLHCTGAIYVGLRWNVSSFYGCQYDFGEEMAKQMRLLQPEFFKRNKID